MNSKQWLTAICLLGAFTAQARADEGMWLYNQPPTTVLKERYDFEAAPAWLDHLMKSSVRFNVGGSGAFVSADGLVMTNHHVAADAIQKLSGPGKDLMARGYLAKTRAQELKCLDLELNVLQSIEDVTPKVLAALQPGMDEAQAEKARRAAINTLEQEETQRTGLRCDVVTLFRGGAYHIYRYKRYTDVRLVFAPELGIAFFGGDTDNFEYPRQCLDVTFLRVYENGQPVKPAHYLSWSQAGVKEGDLIFVSGHPARTNRLNTVAHLKFLRDVQYPFILNYLRRLEVLLNTYSERSQENRRQAQDERYGVQNGRKARGGALQGLQDPVTMAEKEAREQALRQSVTADPRLAAAYGPAWAEVEGAVATLRAMYLRYALLEQARAFNSQLFHLARVLVRRAVEQQKPNAERLREFGDAHKESLERDLFSPAPIYPGLEEAKLANSLAMLMEVLGAEDATVRLVLQGQSPPQRASQLIRGSRLAEVEYRRQLAGMSVAELRASSDPMIALAWAVETEARQLRDDHDKKVSSVFEQAYAKVARASLGAGQALYPDATFSLRFAFGKVAGTPSAPYTTTLGSLYAKMDEHRGQYPFGLPPRWLSARRKLNLATPFDFICTADIIGGNSGSPVVNRQGEVVGLIFDGNLDSLAWDFHYADRLGRSLAVDSRAIIEALRRVYDFPQLADELQRGK